MTKHEKWRIPTPRNQSHVMGSPRVTTTISSPHLSPILPPLRHVRSRSCRSVSEIISSSSSSTPDDSISTSTSTSTTSLSIPTSSSSSIIDSSPSHLSPSSSTSSSASSSPLSPHRDLHKHDDFPSASSPTFHLIITVPLTMYSHVDTILQSYPHHHVTVLSKPLRPYQLLRHVHRMIGVSSTTGSPFIPPMTLSQRASSVPTPLPSSTINIPVSPLISSSYPSSIPPSISIQPSHHTSILLCDDNLINLKVATKLLSKWFTFNMIDTCRDGRNAVEMYTSRCTSSNPYVAIFMDYDMPHMNGVEAATAIRSYERQHALPSIPLICMTGNTHENDIIITREAGFNDFIPKPLRMVTIQSCIHKHRLDTITSPSPSLEPIPSPSHSISSSDVDMDISRELHVDLMEPVHEKWISSPSTNSDTMETSSTSSPPYNKTSTFTPPAHPMCAVPE